MNVERTMRLGEPAKQPSQARVQISDGMDVCQILRKRKSSNHNEIGGIGLPTPSHQVHFTWSILHFNADIALLTMDIISCFES